MPSAACETQGPTRRGRGRPRRDVPDWIVAALQRTATEGGRATLDRTGGDTPLTAEGLHELRLALRAGVAHLGGKLRVQTTQTHISFWMVRPAAEGADDDAGE